MQSFDGTSIVLVGLCNEDRFLQMLIGTIVVQKDENDKPEPRLILIQPDEKDGLPSNPLKPLFRCKKKGQYGLAFPTFAGGHGVMISLNTEKGTYDFSTGLHSYDGGSSGPLSNGGPELVELLDHIFGFSPTQ
jgi:hypothetical protein